MNTGLINEAMVQEYQKTGNDEVLNAIYQKNIGLINILVTPYVESIPKAELDDLLQEAWFPMKKAIEGFDPSRGNSFTTLLKSYVNQHMNRLYDEATRKKRFNGIIPDSVERITEICKENDIEDNVYSVDCTDFNSVEFRQFLRSIELSDSERVVVNVIMNGGSKGDCSNTLEIKPASVTYWLKRLKKKFIVAGYCI